MKIDNFVMKYKWLKLVKERDREREGGDSQQTIAV